MSEITLQNVASLLREAYYGLSVSGQENKITQSIKKIAEIKAYFDELYHRDRKNHEECLLQAELAMIIWEYEPLNKPTKSQLIKLHQDLDAYQEPKSTSVSSKWESPELAVKDVISSISRLTITPSKEQTKQKNLSKKISNWLRKIEEDSSGEQDFFGTLYQSLHGDGRINKEEFLQAIILFYREIVGSKEDLVDYQKALEFQFQALSMDELKLFKKQMESTEMLSLATALYSQVYLGTHYDDLEHFEHPAYQDALSLLSNEKQWLKDNLRGNFTSAEALEQKTNEQFLVDARFIFKILSLCHRTVFAQIQRRKNKTEESSNCFPYSWLDAWPVNDKMEPEVISISEPEKKLVGSMVKMFITTKKDMQKQNLAKDTQAKFINAGDLEEKPLLQPVILGQYFGNMVKSLGFFFNPAKFIEALQIFQEDTASVRQKMTEMDDKALEKIYAEFKGEDLNNLVVLLRQIKNGNQKNMGDLCRWLTIERIDPINFNKNIQKIAGDLYDTADSLMQIVRQEVDKRESERYSSFERMSELESREYFRDYAYNDLTLPEDRVFTSKNAACVKQLLSSYYPKSERAEYKVRLTLWDRFYHFLYPSDKNMLPSETKTQSYREIKDTSGTSDRVRAFDGQLAKDLISMVN
jgi:hypothetical protein